MLWTIFLILLVLWWDREQRTVKLVLATPIGHLSTLLDLGLVQRNICIRPSE